MYIHNQKYIYSQQKQNTKCDLNNSDLESGQRGDKNIGAPKRRNNFSVIKLLILPKQYSIFLYFFL